MWRRRAYLAAEKRLSNEFADTTGCAPATMPSLGVAGAGAGAGASAAASVTAGFKGGRLAACLLSPFAFGIEASGRGGLPSAALGLVGTGCAVAVAAESVDALPRPILWARLEKK